LGWFGGHLLAAAGLGAAGGLGGGGGGCTAAVAGWGGATAGFGGGGGGTVRMASCFGGVGGGGEFARFRSTFGGLLSGLRSGLAMVVLVSWEPPLPELVFACVPVVGFPDVVAAPLSSLRLVVLPLSSLALLGLAVAPAPAAAPPGDVVVPSLALPGVKPLGPAVPDPF